MEALAKSAEALRAKQVTQGLVVAAEWEDQMALTKVPLATFLKEAANDEGLVERVIARANEFNSDSPFYAQELFAALAKEVENA